MKTILYSLLLTSLATVVQAADVRPNVVLIVSDDQGYRDLGCYGSEEVKTPNLDRLAQSGVKLTNFYVSWPACTPSRGSLLTGRYPQRNGIFDMIRNEAPDYGHKYSKENYAVTFERIGGMDTREVLLPSMLKKAGYTSGIFGKWDLGVHKRFLPIARGFDTFYGFVNTGIDYFTHERYGVPSMYRDNLPTEEDKGTYCTELFMREARAFIRNNYNKPFFLYMPFNAPHGASNLDPTIRSAAQGTDEYKKLYPKLLSQAGVQNGNKYGRPATVRNKASRRLEYVASITQMDAAIGSLLNQLEQLGVAQNTLVIFMSDNGGSGSSDNGILRGNKGQMFEGGIRVPAIVSLPGRIPAGETRNGFCSSIDLLPTIVEYCSTSVPDKLTFDGQSLSLFLEGRAKSPRKRMFWQRRGDKAARVGTWKWVESERGNGLFNLKSDPGEKEDLSEENPAQLKRMQDAFANWKQQMDRAEPRGPFRDF